MSFNWSFTKIDIFKECLRKFQYQFVDKRSKEIKCDAFAIGEGLHQFLEYYSIHPQAALKDCQQVYKKGASEHPALENKNQIEFNLHLVDRYMRSGKRLEPKINSIGDPCTEKWFSLDCGNRVKCNGKIDIVTIAEAVVDYKSAKRPYRFIDVEQVLNGKGLQLSIYAGAYQQWFDRIPKAVGFQVLLKDGSEVQNIGSIRTEKHIQDTKDLILYTDKKYKSLTEFPKNSFAKCSWCNFEEICKGDK